jgi:hypothetical protein
VAQQNQTRRTPKGEVVYAQIPGPTRKRTPTSYRYRMTYRNEAKHQRGCVLQWDVMGGRDIYQVALEREDGGKLRWHCTCADAAFRGETRPYCCKHVRGLQAMGRPFAEKR